MTRSKPEGVIDILWRPREEASPPRIFAILDGARDDRIYKGVTAGDADYSCLYAGELPAELAQTAPYLVRLELGQKLTTWLLDNGWGNSWGIFLESEAEMLALRRHFRKFLMVYGDKGQPLYFRYYDPRVLRVFLPTCTEEELKTLFGPVDYYLVESDDGSAVIRFSQSRSHLVKKVIAVT